LFQTALANTVEPNGDDRKWEKRPCLFSIVLNVRATITGEKCTPCPALLPPISVN